MTNKVRKLRPDEQDGKSQVFFWVIATYISLLFLTGGSSRADEPLSLLVVPVSIVICGFAALTLNKSHLRGRLVPALILIATILTSIVHLTPLPAAIINPFHSAIEVEVSQILGNEAFKQLTVSPLYGRDAAFALAVPLAIFLAAIQLDRPHLNKLLIPVMVLGMLSGLLGLFQVVSGGQSSLYLYRITNNGAAVGLFANRNHAASMLALLFPIFAIYAGSNAKTPDIKRKRQIGVLAAISILLPLILVVGSRSGLLLSLFSITCSVVLYQRLSKKQIGKSGYFPSGVQMVAIGATLLLGAITYFFARAEALDRFFQIVPAEMGRGTFWNISMEQFLLYLPMGSGSGSFSHIFQLVEPIDLLNPAYLNRAHNDYLEVAITFGLPGLFLMSCFIIWYSFCTLWLWRCMDGSRYNVAMARMAGILIAVIGAASAADYPLRTPIIMAIFTLCTLWFTETKMPSRQNSHDGTATKWERL